MATDGGDDRWRNVLEARSVTVYPADGDPVDLQAYLDGLGAGEVTVAWADVTGKPATFPPAAHTHAAADVSSGTLAVARIPTGTTASTVALGNHTHAGLLTGSASAVADSAAADVAALVADHNALLAALRARGIIT